MSKKNNEHKIGKWLQEHSVWILGVIVTVLNLWLANQLAPLAQSIRVLEIRVDAIETRQDRMLTTLIRIEDKIDNLMIKCLE
jgi:hypothetical protein